MIIQLRSLSTSLSFQPFWPTGSGCARGFLGVFDAAWMLRQYCGAGGEVTIGDVLAERESAYRLLAQTTPENLSKSFASYTIDPRSRYPRFEATAILPAQVRYSFLPLYDESLCWYLLFFRCVH